MHEIRNILAATDLSPTSDGVLRAAAEMALRAGARLHVLHAVGLPVASVLAHGLEPRIDAQLYDEQRASAARLLDAQLERSVPRGVQAVLALDGGEAAPRAICRHAEEVSADLIVIGPHGEGERSAGFLGTTADRVLRSASVPVLVLRETAPVPTRRILVPADLSEPSAGIVEVALGWAAAFGPPPEGSPPPAVDVVHVALGFAAGRMPFDRATVEPGRNAELQAARERAPGAAQVVVRELVLWGELVEETILEYAREWKPDLLVAGSHGRGAIKRALLGATSSSLARHAPCSVLLVPPALWADAGDAAEGSGPGGTHAA